MPELLPLNLTLSESQFMKATVGWFCLFFFFSPLTSVEIIPNHYLFPVNKCSHYRAPVICLGSVLPVSKSIFTLKHCHITGNRKASLIEYIWTHTNYANKNKAATLAQRSRAVIE